MTEDIPTRFVAVGYSYPSEPPQPIKFIADHPFLFLILHEDKTLFAGTYSK